MEFRLPIRFPDPKWIASGQTEQFCGYEIPGPICVRDNFEIDAPGFFIDPKLPIVDGKAELLPADDGADDYSKYKPSRRGRYLRWRVEGRPPNIANGNSIAFLQQDFWPFEWRLLAQGDTDPKLVLALVDFVAQHTEAMIKTGLGLLANRLLHLVTLRLGAVPQLNLIQSLRCLPAVMWGREEVGLMLSTHERFNVPLAADLAALVAGILASPGEREVILKRSSEFRGVFIPSFNEHYPRGLKVQRPVDRCSFHCTPRHPDTQQEITARGIDTRFEIGDFFKDPSQFQGLMDVCRMALTKLGRDPRPVAAGVVGSPRPRSTTNHQSKGRFDEVTVRPAG